MKKLKNKGFSLVELLVAITILSIVTVPLLRSFVTSAKTAARSRQMGNATLAARSLAEYVEAHDVEDLLKTPAAAFNKPDEAAANRTALKGYGESGDDSFTEIDVDARKNVICLENVHVNENAVFNARVTLNAGEAEGDLYKVSNDKPMSEYGDMDAVFAQSRNSTDDPDQLAQDAFEEFVATNHSSWDDDDYDIQRHIELVVKKNDAEPEKKLDATLKFTYTYTYTYYSNEIQDDGTIASVPYSGEREEVREYTLFPHGFTYEINGVERFPNIYVMYYPMYDNKGASIDVLGDNISIYNENDIEFKLFLVKQREPDTTDEVLNTWQNGYQSEIVQYQDYAHASTPVDGRYEPVAKVYSNAQESLTDSPATMSVTYGLVLGHVLRQSADFAGQGANSLVDQSARNRLYEVTVEVFLPGTTFPGDRLYTIKTTKLQ